MVHLHRDDVLLIVKATAATVLAWVVADRLMDSPTPFYAPLAALLVVDKTMVRSVAASVRRIVAVGLGMALAWLVGSTLGLHWWSMGLVILGALVIGRWSRLKDHGIQVPSMALLSLLTAGGTSQDFTALTMLETLVGGTIGIVVNLVVLAPLHVDEPREQLLDYRRRVRELIDEVAGSLREGHWDAEAARAWTTSTDALHDEEPRIFDLIELGRESQRFNPRDELQRISPSWDGYRELVEALRRVTWHVGGIVRTLRDDLDNDTDAQPGTEFLGRIADVLDDVAAAIEDYGTEGEDALETVRSRLDHAGGLVDDLATRLHETPLDNPRAWPVHGALLHDYRRLVGDLRTRAGDAVLPPTPG